MVTLPAVLGAWNTLRITPCDDLAALWPDMNAHDFSSFVITLSAVSNGGLASGYFDYLRFTRQHTSGDVSHRPLRTSASEAGRARTSPEGRRAAGTKTGVRRG